MESIFCKWRLSSKPSVRPLFKSLHRRLIIASLHQTSIVRKPAPDETPSTTLSFSTQWDLHLSVTSTHGNRTLPTLSRQWKALRTEILLRDNRTCSSCGYLSPYPNGRWMIVDHINGDASNNDPSNLRVLCPPCDAIRHCGFAGLQKWLIVSESTMKQVEIVRKTREIFENSGVIPYPELIDPSLKPASIDVVKFANMMLITPWKDLPKEFKRLRGFFTEHASRLFRDTMLIEKSNTKHSALELGPRITYSRELHESSQVFLDSWLPSKTLKTQAAWICVHNPRSAESEDESPDRLYELSNLWDTMSISQCEPPTTKDVDGLAKSCNVLSGKWLVFVSSDEVDDLWGRIAESTLAGTLGNAAKVSTRDESDLASKHVICVHSADYTSTEDVNRIRDELRRLGVEQRIPYKPDVYTYCNIFRGNKWGIPVSRYIS